MERIVARLSCKLRLSSLQRRRSATKPHPTKESRGGRKGARAGTCTRTHTTSQTSTHNSVAANARPRTQRGHDSTPPTSGRSHYFKLREQATTSIQFYRVPPVGLEPTAIRLKVCCSNQLSYRGLSSPGPLARVHAQGASGGTIRAAVCEGIQRPACLHYRPHSPLTRPASHVRLARQTRQQTRVWVVQPRVTVGDNALWAR